MSSSTTNINIPNNYDIQLGGDGNVIKSDTGIDLTVTKPIVTQSSSKSDSTAKLDLKIEPVDLKIEPLDLKIEPLKVDTDSKIDVKPLAVDSCTTIKLAPLPPTRIEQPYCQHFGFTYMGIELFGFTVSGRSEMLLQSPSKPQYHTVHAPEAHAGHEDCEESHSPARSKGGLRVRIGDRH
jgi:hypothetical protein